MDYGNSEFGWVEIDGRRYEHDVVVDRGEIRKRKKGPSKPLRPQFGHTPLSLAEDIPWDCRRLVVGTGAAGALPVTREVVDEAGRRDVELVELPTRQALEELRSRGDAGVNAILHVTC